MAIDDDIPTLTQVVRTGSESRASDNRERTSRTTLSEQEIEAIAQRVMDRYSAALEKTIARAIRRALEHRETPRGK